MDSPGAWEVNLFNPSLYNCDEVEDAHKLSLLLKRYVKIVYVGGRLHDDCVHAFIQFASSPAVRPYAKLYVREGTTKENRYANALYEAVYPHAESTVYRQTDDERLLSNRMSKRIVTSLFTLRTGQSATDFERGHIDSIIRSIDAIGLARNGPTFTAGVADQPPAAATTDDNPPNNCQHDAPGPGGKVNSAYEQVEEYIEHIPKTRYRWNGWKGSTREHLDAFRSLILCGFTRQLTDSTGLLCGLRALVISINGEFGNNTTTEAAMKLVLRSSEVANQLRGHRSIDNHEALEEAMRRNNLDCDTLSLLLKHWCTTTNNQCKLGIVNGKRKDVYIYNPFGDAAPKRTIWVYNDGAEEDGVYGHFEGYARNSEEVLAPDAVVSQDPSAIYKAKPRIFTWQDQVSTGSKLEKMLRDTLEGEELQSPGDVELMSRFMDYLRMRAKEEMDTKLNGCLIIHTNGCMLRDDEIQYVMLYANIWVNTILDYEVDDGNGAGFHDGAAADNTAHDPPIWHSDRSQQGSLTAELFSYTTTKKHSRSEKSTTSRGSRPLKKRIWAIPEVPNDARSHHAVETMLTLVLRYGEMRKGLRPEENEQLAVALSNAKTLLESRQMIDKDGSIARLVKLAEEVTNKVAEDVAEDMARDIAEEVENEDEDEDEVLDGVEVIDLTMSSSETTSSLAIRTRIGRTLEIPCSTDSTNDSNVGINEKPSGQFVAPRTTEYASQQESSAREANNVDDENDEDDEDDEL